MIYNVFYFEQIDLHDNDNLPSLSSASFPWHHGIHCLGLDCGLTADLKIKNQFSGQEDTGRIYIIYIMGYIIRQRCIYYILYCLIHRTQINVVCNYQQSHNCCRVMPLVLLRSGASLDTYILSIYSI